LKSLTARSPARTDRGLSRVGAKSAIALVIPRRSRSDLDRSLKVQNTRTGAGRRSWLTRLSARAARACDSRTPGPWTQPRGSPLLTLLRSTAEVSRGASERSRAIRTEIRADAADLDIERLGDLLERLLQVRAEDFDGRSGLASLPGRPPHVQTRRNRGRALRRGRHRSRIRPRAVRRASPGRRRHQPHRGHRQRHSTHRTRSADRDSGDAAIVACGANEARDERQSSRTIARRDAACVKGPGPRTRCCCLPRRVLVYETVRLSVPMA
jgi:hypothetical protein